MRKPFTTSSIAIRIKGKPRLCPFKDELSQVNSGPFILIVDIHYLAQPCEDYISKAVETILQIHLSEGPGDILVFLTGKEDIETACELVNDRLLE